MISRFCEEYRKNVKPFWQEEPFDYLIYRPIAFLVIKVTYFLQLTPNHFSILALVTALASGYFLASGTAMGFIYGGTGIFFFGVWDCCDGMLARMKGKGDPYGQFIDMFVDVLSAVSFYGGLCWGLMNVNNKLYFWLTLLSGVILCIHAGIYNFYKKQFLFYMSGTPNGRIDEIENLEKILERLKKGRGSVFKRFLIQSFLLFVRVQKSSDNLLQYDVEDYISRNKMTLGLWGIIAGSSHLFLLSLSLLCSEMDIYLGFALVFSNLWLVLALLAQRRVNSQLRMAVL